MSLRDLPDYDEFSSLFSRYKITSWTTRITPTFDRPMAGSFGAPGPANAARNAMPMMEFFIIPATYHVHPNQRDYANLTDDEITDILNQTQIKSRRLMPSKGFTFKTNNPLIPRTGFIPGRTDAQIHNVEAYLGKAPWLENGPGPHHGGIVNNDQRQIMHLGYTVLARRVDIGDIKQLSPSGVLDGTPPGPINTMKWRVTTQAFMKFDKVR